MIEIIITVIIILYLFSIYCCIVISIGVFYILFLDSNIWNNIQYNFKILFSISVDKNK